MKETFTYYLTSTDVKHYRHYVYWNLVSLLPVALCFALFAYFMAQGIGYSNIPLLFVPLLAISAYLVVSSPAKHAERKENELKTRRLLLLQYKDFTGLGVQHFPVTPEERKGVRRDIERRFSLLALDASKEISCRNALKKAVERKESVLLVGTVSLENLPAIRNELAGLRNKLDSAEKRASEWHKRFLAAWDLLVRRTGILENLSNENPDTWREEEYERHLQNSQTGA